MPKSSLYGMPARYLATPPTLTDGDAVPLLVNQSGALVVTGGNVSSQAYTVSNFTPTRTYNAGTASSADTNNTLATLISDLKAAGILQ